MGGGKKMNKKAKKVLFITLSVIIVLAVAGFSGYRIVMNRAGDTAMRKVIEDQLDDMLDSGEITIEDVENVADAIDAEKAPENESPDDQNDEAEKAETPPSGGDKAAPKNNADSGTARKQTVKKAAEKIEKTIPRSEKDEMMRFVLSRLSADDVRYLSGLLKGGLTAEEKASAKALAYSRFSAEEIKRVREYYKKYSGMVSGAK